MIISEICSIPNYTKKYTMSSDLYDFLAKKYGKFYFINCHYLVDKKKITFNLKNFKNKKIFFFHPKSYSELNNFLKKNKIFLINNLSPKFYHLQIHLMLNKLNIHQVAFDNLGEMSSYKLENWDAVKIDKKIHFFYLKKISYIIYRILIFLKFIKPINKLFIARKDLLKKYRSRSNIFKIFFNTRYVNLHPIKPKFPINKKKDDIGTKFIVFLDQNVNHKDNTSRGYALKKNKQIEYFRKLQNYLIKLSKLSKKKPIICLHPSSSYKLYSKHIKNIKIVQFKTDYYILKSFIVIFHDSSSVTSAFFLNKRIINLKSDILGYYINKRSELYSRKVKLVTHNLNNYEDKINKKMLNLLKKNIKKQKLFLKKTFFTDDNYKNLNVAISEEINILTKSNS
tara:strand:+ start:35069 stop:36256 length:1188 start_codon:yes stop_codon:yes gene_type:complete